MLIIQFEEIYFRRESLETWTSDNVIFNMEHEVIHIDVFAANYYWER